MMAKKAGAKEEKQKPKRQARIFPITKRSEFLRPYSINLANRLETYRKMRRLRQKDFAKMVGVAPSVISNFESGWANPSLVNLLRICCHRWTYIDQFLFKQITKW
mgnify:FL=1